MKELEITELMREYTDDEFNIEGENAADTEKVVESVMGQVKAKKKAKPLFRVLIAAAAAVVVLAGAVTAGTVLTGSYTTIIGRQVEWEHDYDEEGYGSGWISTTTGELEDVLTLRDGRLYFNVNGDSTDITDLIDRTTPYIYTYTIPESEKPAYIIAGGTAEEYAVVDLVYTEDTSWFGVGIINGDALGGSVDVQIYSNVSSSGEMKHYYDYCSDIDYRISYTIWDDDLRPVKDYSYDVTRIYPTWRDDADAWLIEALLQLELIELPKIENFVLPSIVVENDTVTLWGDTDLTEEISEEKPYVHRSLWSDEGYEKVTIVGGTPGNFGWAYIEKRTENENAKGDAEYWTIAEYNVTDADGELRDWYLNAVKRKGYDLEELRQNQYFEN